jgi:hypothetical protein
MTERVLPAIALPSPGRIAREHAGAPAARARPATPAHAARRGEPLLTMPARAGMLVGVSAAVYAVTLTGVSALQSRSDAQAIARQEPWLSEVAASRAANDELEAALLAAGVEARALAGEYARTGEAVAAYEARLDALAALVAEVQGTAASLPARISLPKVTVRGATRTTRPATTATTGASGG